MKVEVVLAQVGGPLTTGPGKWFSAGRDKRAAALPWSVRARHRDDAEQRDFPPASLSCAKQERGLWLTFIPVSFVLFLLFASFFRFLVLFFFSLFYIYRRKGIVSELSSSQWSPPILSRFNLDIWHITSRAACKNDIIKAPWSKESPGK